MAKQKYDSQILFSFYCTNQPVLANGKQTPGLGCVHWSLEERLSSCHFPRRAVLWLQGFLPGLQRPGSSHLRSKSSEAEVWAFGKISIVGGGIMSLCPSRSSSQCLRQEVRPIEFTMRTNSATADQDWPSQISGAITCLSPWLPSALLCIRDPVSPGNSTLTLRRSRMNTSHLV